MKKIFLAGGCFWGLEAYFQRVKGIIDTEVGYANSTVKNPTYKEVCSGETNAVETLMICYDSDIISLEKILRHFFLNIDPTDLNRQGNDIGTQYRTGIYYENVEDKEIIENEIKVEEKKYFKPIVTEVSKLENFYPAEEIHQNYLLKNPAGYCHNLHAILQLKKSLDYNGK